MAVDRFSRLYPLHALTLALVTLIQILYYQRTSQHFGYEHTDLYHFALNALLIHAWGLSDGFSYNGPSWSISIEVLLYIIFFFVAKRATSTAAIIAGVLVVGGGLLVFLGVENVGRGLMCFFAGGLASILFLRTRPNTCALPALCSAAIFVLTAAAIAAASWSWSPSFSWEIILNVLVFPAVILLLALCQEKWPWMGQRVAVVGDLTYASYLWHFPVQMMINLISFSFAWAIDFDHPVALSVYMTLIVSLSLLTNWYFERPVQAKIRRLVTYDKIFGAHVKLAIFRQGGV